jgi:hypothetical protein
MTSPRLAIPHLLGGDWESVLICTYGAELEFFEQDLWRQLDRTKNRIIVADATQVRRYLQQDRSVRLRHLNRTYALAPVSAHGAAHAKMIMLLRDDAGWLAVGSGNLSFNGYASQGESFTTYRWAPDDDQHQAAFAAARAFLDELGNRELIGPIVRTQIARAWQTAPWLYEATDIGSSPIRHNLDTPLLDQFVMAIGGEAVKELTIHAPFFDRNCEALNQLLSRTAPARLRILLQERMTSVDPQRLLHTLDHTSAVVDVRSVQAPEKGTFLHAKFLIAKLDARTVCLQGSPNLSGPALIQRATQGNIELANLLTGPKSKFDHLIDSLEISSRSVDVLSLDLGWAGDDELTEEDEDLTPERVRELSWSRPRLSGFFTEIVDDPPTLLISNEVEAAVEWILEATPGGETRFAVTLGEHGCALLDRLQVVHFQFIDGVSAPLFPYHVSTLTALSTGSGRADLIREAGDFNVDDEELEQLLLQLDEVLVVDGRSIWRMLRRQEPESRDGKDAPRLAYEDLDWNLIRSHPKFAQYQHWNNGQYSEPTGLGILLGSIADRFRKDVAQRRGEAAAEVPQDVGPDDPFDDLGLPPDVESEEESEEVDLQRERRRQTARARARNLFRNFVKRFVSGITDPDFVDLVGPSVVLPSYVVFNHICWKLATLELTDGRIVVDAQLALWRFFWGTSENTGYLHSLSEPEQVAALEILERHHSEAVLLASICEAYDTAYYEAHDLLIALRDQLRIIVTHDLWQPTTEAVSEAAAVSGVGPGPMSGDDFLTELASLAYTCATDEPQEAIAAAVGANPNSVEKVEARVRRGLVEQMVELYVINDSDARLTASTAPAAFSALMAIYPEADYLRLSHPATHTMAFADFENNQFIWANTESYESKELDEPRRVECDWEKALEGLERLAA